jgi:hypothetical protein
MIEHHVDPIISIFRGNNAAGFHGRFPVSLRKPGNDTRSGFSNQRYMAVAKDRGLVITTTLNSFSRPFYQLVQQS